MQDKEKTRQLQGNWEKVAAVLEEENSEKWQETLELLQETLDGVLTLLQFKGANLTENYKK